MTQIHTPSACRAGALVAIVFSLPSAVALAANPKASTSALAQKAFFRPELSISTSNAPLEDVLSQLPNRARWETFLLAQGAQGKNSAWSGRVFIDPRSGAATNIMGPFPLIPGDGAGNRVTLSDVARSLGRPVTTVGDVTVAAALRQFAERHRDLLGIDTRQLGEARAMQIHADLWQVTIPQVYEGLPVRDGRLAASISHGNLVVIGTEAWANVRVVETPRLTADEALAAGFAHADGRAAEDVIVRAPRLEIVPVAPQEFQHGEAFAGAVGRGLAHRLVWTFVFQRPPDDALWEVMVEAASGEVMAFQDINRYQERRQITGGVYPLTSTEICPSAQQCGEMQSDWPMPFADTGFASPNNFTNSAGIYNYTSGMAATTLTGKFVDISDVCGAINQSSANGTIDMGGANGDHDCTVPLGASPGNTASSRSCFYEVNRIAELARGYLPTNAWLQSRITSNVNIQDTCNAFYSPGNGSINFFRSGGGCRNTGEIAGVFDHEWGHALDDNDTGGALSNSSEAYADIAAIFRLQTSCVGHGFFQTVNQGCGTTADGTGFNADEAQVGPLHCDLDCSGVRDADYLKHNPNTPDTALGFVCGSCGSGPGPCGRQVHCAAAPSRQAAWDLAARDLQTAPFNLDSQTAFIIANKLFYQGSGNIGVWHACTCGDSSDGCGATNAYMQWLTADDDNGNLFDGTPHMTALFNAFDRHGIACPGRLIDSGCSGGPTLAPTLGVTPGNFQNALSWTGVAGATRYWVFRTEGHAGCNFGKALIADVTGTVYTDNEVANGRTYYYNVVAAAASSACFGRASNCASGTPSASPDFSLSCSPSSLSIAQGSSGNSTCTVSSQNGFSSPTSLDCTNLPAGVTCTYIPNPVTPPSGSSANSTLTVAVGSVATGTYNFKARGTSGSLVHTFDMTLQVTPSPTPDFSLSCSPSSLSIAQGSSGNSTCTVSSQNTFSSAVNLDCTNLPTGVSCIYNPTSVTPPSGGSATSTLTVNVDSGVAPGPYNFKARGTSGSLVHTFDMTLQVTSSGGDFALSAAPPSRTVFGGQSTTYTVTVTPSGGFSGTVTFSTGSLPAGVSASFSPPSVTGAGSSLMTITTTRWPPPGTPTGTHTLTIIGTSGSLVRTTTVQLVVQ